MLRIYDDCLVMVREVGGMARQIDRWDRDHARQLRRSALSVASNVAEGSGCRGGTRTQRYHDALGSAREALAQLEAAEAIGYVEPLRPEVRARFNRIIGTLVRVLYKR